MAATKKAAAKKAPVKKAAPKAAPAKRARDKDGLTRKDKVYRAVLDNPELTADELLKLPGCKDLATSTVRKWLGRWQRKLGIPRASREYKAAKRKAGKRGAK